MADWTCACGVANHARYGVCSNCGASRPDRPAPQNLRAGLCEWQQPRPCLMPGSASLDGRRWLCSWHLASLASPRSVDDFDEFTAWVGGLLEAAICAEWTHWPVGSLWTAVQGQQGLVGYRAPCSQPGCPHRDLGEWEGSPGAAVAQIQRALLRIGRVSAPGALAPLSDTRVAI